MSFPSFLATLLFVWGTHVSAVSPSALILNVVDFGAVPDGSTVNTAAIHAMMDHISTVSGPVVAYFPPGVYVSGPFNLTAQSTLLLDGATLQAVNYSSDWPLIDWLPSYGQVCIRAPSPSLYCRAGCVLVSIPPFAPRMRGQTRRRL